jgi:histidine triad (HIT) family protein
MYNHAPQGYRCPFCLLVQGQQDPHLYSNGDDIVYRDALVTALISSHQWPKNHGNTLVIPAEHYENLYDLPLHFAPRMHDVIRAVALAMKSVWGCDGVSTRQHNEPGGGQDVWHYHVHVTPRYDEDAFYGTPREFMPAPQRAVYAQQLREALRGWQPTP